MGTSRTPIKRGWTALDDKVRPGHQGAVNLKRLRTEVVPVLAWGCTTWHLKEDSIWLAEVAIIRMTRSMLRAHRTESDTWLAWHVQ